MNTISGASPYKKHRRQVLGREMAYVDAGAVPRNEGRVRPKAMAKQKQPAGPPMTLGNMRELGVRGPFIDRSV
jgi:hypothetical protein